MMPPAITPHCIATRKHNAESGESWLEFDFNVVLSRRATDWSVYKNAWEQEHKANEAVVKSGRAQARRFFQEGYDSELVRALIKGLLEDGTGVELVTVKPYKLAVFGSRAVPDECIIEVMNSAAKQLELASIRLEDLELSARSYNRLMRGGIHTAAELLEKSRTEIERIPDLGAKSCNEIEEVVQERGWQLRQD